MSESAYRTPASYIMLCTSRGLVVLDVDEIIKLVELVEADRTERGENMPRSAKEWRTALVDISI